MKVKNWFEDEAQVNQCQLRDLKELMKDLKIRPVMQPRSTSPRPRSAAADLDGDDDKMSDQIFSSETSYNLSCVLYFWWIGWISYWYMEGKFFGLMECIMDMILTFFYKNTVMVPTTIFDTPFLYLLLVNGQWWAGGWRRGCAPTCDGCFMSCARCLELWLRLAVLILFRWTEWK